MELPPSPDTPGSDAPVPSTPTPAPAPPPPRPRRPPPRRNGSRRLIGGLLGFFGVFVGLLFGMNHYAVQRKQPYVNVRQAGTVAELQTLWQGFASDEKAKPGLRDSARHRLAALRPSPAEIDAADKWLGERPRPLNVVVVPDLSNRLDETKHPRQIQDDTLLLHHIWAEFERLTRKRRRSPDRLVVELTDPQQAAGRFAGAVDSLVFDLASHNPAEM